MALVPEHDTEIISEIAEVEEPTYTWRINIDGDDGMIGSISGYTEELEAIKQRLYLRLNTPKNKLKIFGDTGYGIETEDLVGKPIDYVIPEIDRRYTEAILDEGKEILSVGDFAFDIAENRSDVLQVSCTVSTIFGDVTLNNGVAV